MSSPWPVAAVPRLRVAWLRSEVSRNEANAPEPARREHVVTMDRRRGLRTDMEVSLENLDVRSNQTSVPKTF